MRIDSVTLSDPELVQTADGGPGLLDLIDRTQTWRGRAVMRLRSRRYLGHMAFTGFLYLIPASLMGQTTPADVEVEVREAAAAFIDAFNDLAWDRFEASWAEDATAFFPMPAYIERLEGRDAIMSAFRQIFAGVPEQSEGPPYLSIRPLDLQVQVAPDVGIVTFHLGDAVPPNRRTIVFENRGGRWLIIHLHASRPPEG